MENKEKESQKETAIREEFDEEEINLIEYFRVLWKRKYFILLGSVLPALLVGLIFFFWPRKFKVTYVYDVRGQSVYDVRGQSVYDVRDQSIYDVRGQSVYDVRGQSVYDVRDQSVYDVSNWNLNERNYNVLISRFYSGENLDKITNKLRENGLNEYAELVGSAGNNLDDLKNLLKFKPVPPYIDLAEAKVTNPEQLEQIRKLTAQSLNITIVGKPEKDLPKISSVIRDNLENVIPVYMAQEQLSTGMRTYKTRMADIESNRFSLELDLKTNSSALEKLKSMKTQTPDKMERDIILQFNVEGRSEYLLSGYQIQAVESKIVELEKQVKMNEAKYKYYKDLLALSEKCFAELKKSTSSYYTIQQFHSFLTELIVGYKAEELKDYLASYIKRIENRISVSAPISENPKISPIAKGTAKKSAIVFVVALMMSVFISFLLEGLKKSQAQAS